PSKGSRAGQSAAVASRGGSCDGARRTRMSQLPRRAPARPTGTVYLVGAGPGAADLLTLRAARLLAEADIVLHDALVAPEVLAMASKAVLLPVGKRCGKLSST